MPALALWTQLGPALRAPPAQVGPQWESRVGGPSQEVWSEKGEDQVWEGLGVLPPSPFSGHWAAPQVSCRALPPHPLTRLYILSISQNLTTLPFPRPQPPTKNAGQLPSWAPYLQPRPSTPSRLGKAGPYRASS